MLFKLLARKENAADVRKGKTYSLILGILL
jgi:hypothetical protein